MSPQAAECLLAEIYPILKATIPRTVTPIGTEDHKELIQDAVGDAARAVDSMERSGKELLPRSIAYYTIQRSKIGRRMLDAGASDVLSPMRRINGAGGVVGFDDPIDMDDAGGAPICEALCDHRPDPSEEAARRLDWATMLDHLEPSNAASSRRWPRAR